MTRGSLRAWQAGLGLIVVLAGPGSLRAHGTFHARIERATAEIEASPEDAALYVARSVVYRNHDDWALALADLDRAAALDPTLAVVDFQRGRVRLAAGEFALAEAALGRFLEREPDHVAARVARARARVELRHPLEAAADYTVAIDRERAPNPDHYTERARALLAAGDEYAEQALTGLEEGLARLGPFVPMMALCADIEVALGRIDAALARLDRVAEQTPRRESWWLRKGEILEAAGRREEASRAYASVLAEVEKLPAHRRGVPATAELERRARAGAARLAGGE